MKNHLQDQLLICITGQFLWEINLPGRIHISRFHEHGLLSVSPVPSPSYSKLITPDQGTHVVPTIKWAPGKYEIYFSSSKELLSSLVSHQPRLIPSDIMARQMSQLRP